MVGGLDKQGEALVLLIQLIHMVEPVCFLCNRNQRWSGNLGGSYQHGKNNKQRPPSLFKKRAQQHGTVTAPGYFPLTQNCLTHEPLISAKHTHTKKKKLALVYMWALKIIYSCNIVTAECFTMAASHFFTNDGGLWAHLHIGTIPFLITSARTFVPWRAT